MDEPVFTVIDLGDQQLRAATWGEGRPDIVLLHDGLGSISQWRDIPARIAAETSCTVFAYERRGHGESVPIPTGPWPTDWMHREATTLERLLDVVLGNESTTRPVLVGHSDGGTTALLYAASPSSRARAVLSLAAHSWLEDMCFQSITVMRADPVGIEAALARHHHAPKALFEAWSGVWVSDAFRGWDIRPELAAINVPVLVAQGEMDPYASDDQAHLTAAAIGENARSTIVPELGHSMHHDDPVAVVSLITDFFAECS